MDGIPDSPQTKQGKKQDQAHGNGAKARQHLAIQIAHHALLGKPLVNFLVFHAEIPARIRQNGHHRVADGHQAEFIRRGKPAHFKAGNPVGGQIGKPHRKNLPSSFHFPLYHDCILRQSVVDRRNGQ